jgi:hypothetical protein
LEPLAEPLLVLVVELLLVRVLVQLLVRVLALLRVSVLALLVELDSVLWVGLVLLLV